MKFGPDALQDPGYINMTLFWPKSFSKGHTKASKWAKPYVDKSEEKHTFQIRHHIS